MAYNNSARKLKEGMKFVADAVIKKARETNTKILILDKNGKPIKVTASQMEKMIKKKHTA